MSKEDIEVFCIIRGGTRILDRLEIPLRATNAWLLSMVHFAVSYAMSTAEARPLADRAVDIEE